MVQAWSELREYPVHILMGFANFKRCDLSWKSKGKWGLEVKLGHRDGSKILRTGFQLCDFRINAGHWVTLYYTTVI